jgi:hypothetical protein
MIAQLRGTTLQKGKQKDAERRGQDDNALPALATLVFI